VVKEFVSLEVRVLRLFHLASLPQQRVVISSLTGVGLTVWRSAAADRKRSAAVVLSAATLG
jgi:hypothetical protein